MFRFALCFHQVATMWIRDLGLLPLWPLAVTQFFRKDCVNRTEILRTDLHIKLRVDTIILNNQENCVRNFFVKNKC